MAAQRRIFTDFQNHLLPGMHDGPRCAPESAAAFASLRECGVCRVMLTPTYRPSYESVRRFISRRNEAWRQLHGLLPRDMTIRLGAQVLLEPECCAAPDFARLALPDSDYIMLELPLLQFADWVDFELHILLHKQRLKPVFVHFERCLLFYPPQISARLMTVPGAAYQFDIGALTNAEVTAAIRKLVEKGIPVLLGTDARLPAQNFAKLPELLNHLREQLGHTAYSSFVYYSFSFASFSRSSVSSPSPTSG